MVLWNKEILGKYCRYFTKGIDASVRLGIIVGVIVEDIILFFALWGVA